LQSAPGADNPRYATGFIVCFCFQYLEKRFSRGVRIYGAIVYIVQMVSKMLFLHITGPSGLNNSVYNGRALQLS